MSKKTLSRYSGIRRAFFAYCRQDKTRWDFTDRLRAVFIIAGGLLALTWAAVVFAGVN